MSLKYSNGAYKTTSKKQDDISQAIFESFYFAVTMSVNFMQYSGNCWYTYYNANNEIVSQICVNYHGNFVR